MSFRFRKRIKIIPGISLNLSKSGVSTTIGPRGASVSIGKRGSYLNLGVPGTGISYRKKFAQGKAPSPSSNSGVSVIDVHSEATSFTPYGFFLDKTKSINVNVSNDNLIHVKTSIEDSRSELLDIIEKGQQVASALKDLKRKRRNKSSWVGRLFGSKDTIDILDKQIEEYEAHAEELGQQYDDAKVVIEINSNPPVSDQYKKLAGAYAALLQTSKIWDITSEIRNTEHKSSAYSTIERKEVKFKYGDIDFITTEFDPFHLENANGSDIYIFPGFVVQVTIAGNITITDFSDLKFKFYQQRFLEEKHTLPKDAVIIDRTWAKVNKDGSPDRRFSGNYQIPVVHYGAFEFTFPNQTKESYNVSNVSLAESFARELEIYLAFFKKSRSVENVEEPALKNDDFEISDRDHMFEEAARLVVQYQQGTTSLIQRKLKLGYNRAGHILDQLEAAGIVGPFAGGKARDVLFLDTYSLEEYLGALQRGKGTTKQHKLTDEAIELLKEISRKMVALKDDLIVDSTIYDAIAKNTDDPAVDVPVVVASLIFHDVNNIAQRINPEQDDLKYFIAYYIVNELMGNPGGIPENAIALKEYYDFLNKHEVSRIVNKLGKGVAGFKLKVDEEKYDFTLKTTLSLSPFLKANEIDAYEEYKNTMHSFALVLAKADREISVQEQGILKKLFVELSNPFKMREKGATVNISSPNNQSLEQILTEFHSLVGLDNVKEEITRLVNFIKIQQARKEKGLKPTPISYHMVFTGNPGTGKTTVARIISKLYKELGILSGGHLVETDRSGLVAEYVGQTATKVNKVVDSALNGVLFIDEAYALVSEGGNDYGKEAVATLIKRIEDDRDKLVVIFAGYADEMKTFLNTNPGFQSRINRFLDFKDFDVDELKAIFAAKCEKLDYHLTAEAEEKLHVQLAKAVSCKDKSFGNGRFVRNLFEKTLAHHANRIAAEGNLTKETLTTITADDIR